MDIFDISYLSQCLYTWQRQGHKKKPYVAYSEVLWFLPYVIQDPVPHQEAQELSMVHQILGWLCSYTSVIPPGYEHVTNRLLKYYYAVISGLQDILKQLTIIADGGKQLY